MAVASPALERVRAGEATSAAGASTPTVSSPAMVTSPFTPIDAAKGPTGVVIEVGAVFIRERLGSQLEAPQNGMGDGAEEEPWRSDLRSVLYDIFFNLLQANPPERPVVVCESLLTPQFFRSAVADLLLRYLQVPSVLFVPSKGVALIPLQMQTALVVDTGYHDTRILPIFMGAHIVHALTTTVLAGKTYNDRLRSILNERAVVVNPFSKSSQACERLPESVVEDIKVRLCSIQPQSPELAGFTSDKLMQKMRYDMTAEDYIDIDVHTCVYAGEVLFENDGDEGEASIAAAPHRRPMPPRPKHTGDWRHGPNSRLPPASVERIQRLVDTEPQYAAFKALADQFCVVDPAFPPHYLSWLGGSFMGCVEHDQAITQAQYTEGKYKFPDWLRVADVKRTMKERRNPFMVAPSPGPSSTPATTPRRRLISMALSGGVRTRLRDSFSSLSVSSSPYAPPSSSSASASSNSATSSPPQSSFAAPASPYHPSTRRATPTTEPASPTPDQSDD
ncbi:actin subfamily protein [Acanthamoeba castellanii str. Neff]|uniref:Actin subfamily protein n=1 Tax=Acanthamoeba castellanii (strain ATCC 30010 / Neff) TaxID=1257118 RepID=L8GUD8_ACACF|nr:actin subfamily protein [Acanthamoeba castellanii str. Neff]ELR16238.1 actin subfamily protein [Acanthamoeba castellanii str. Neff]